MRLPISPSLRHSNLGPILQLSPASTWSYRGGRGCKPVYCWINFVYCQNLLRMGITWEEAEVAAQNRSNGVGVWRPNASTWVRVESRSRSSRRLRKRTYYSWCKSVELRWSTIPCSLPCQVTILTPATLVRCPRSTIQVGLST